jgi:hypothetical protein
MSQLRTCRVSRDAPHEIVLMAVSAYLIGCYGMCSKLSHVVLGSTLS